VAHEGSVRSRIHQFKFEGRTEWVPALVELLVAAHAGLGSTVPDLILPVPLHAGRLRERGFNQSGLLAGGLARRLRAPVSFDVIVRKSRTQPQTGLTRRERLKNLKGAFDLSGANEVRGRRILLVDDVFTTGATLSECARTLKKKGGASEVSAVTVTRALLG
jgi:ComF family protein